jgi:alkylation response protein AidB-like acyl-CoA dehydrogenase
MSDAAWSDSGEIVSSAASFLARHGGAATARRERACGQPDAGCWTGMAELGWFGVTVPEAAGGVGLGLHVACLIGEQAGRALLMPPLAMAMTSAGLLAASCEPAAHAMLQRLLAGAGHVAFVAEPRAAELSRVPDGDLAEAFLIASGDDERFEARLVARAAAGLVEREDRCVDGSWLTSIRLAPQVVATAPRVLAGCEGQAAWQRALAAFRLIEAAYLCGLMATALGMALEHLRLRRQFGVPIGSFQALQHRASDCHVGIAATRALVFESALAEGTPRAVWWAAASARRASAAALHVTRENIQFHGATGFADEHDAGVCLRRAMSIAARHHSAMATLEAGC